MHLFFRLRSFSARSLRGWLCELCGGFVFSSVGGHSSMLRTDYLHCLRRDLPLIYSSCTRGFSFILPVVCFFLMEFSVLDFSCSVFSLVPIGGGFHTLLDCASSSFQLLRLQNDEKSSTVYSTTLSKRLVVRELPDSFQGNSIVKYV